MEEMEEKNSACLAVIAATRDMGVSPAGLLGHGHTDFRRGGGDLPPRGILDVDPVT